MPRTGSVLALALLAGVIGCDDGSAENDNTAADAGAVDVTPNADDSDSTETRLEDPSLFSRRGDGDGNDSSNGNGNPAEAAKEAAQEADNDAAQEPRPLTP